MSPNLYSAPAALKSAKTSKPSVYCLFGVSAKEFASVASCVAARSARPPPKLSEASPFSATVRTTLSACPYEAMRVESRSSLALSSMGYCVGSAG